MTDPTHAPTPARAPHAADPLVAAAAARPAIWRTALAAVLVPLLALALQALAIGAVILAVGRTRAGEIGAWAAAGASPGAVLLILSSFAMLVAATLAVAWLLHRRGLWALTGPPRRLWRDAALALGLLSLLALPGIAWPGAFEATRPGLAPGLWLALLPATLALVGLQTFAEELFFRGHLQPQIAARIPAARRGALWARALWGGLPALFFAALHFDPSRMGAAAPLAVGAALIFGLIAADLTARTGSIGAAWGLHLGNNLLALGLVAFDGPLTGLALRIAELTAEDLAANPWLVAADALPLLLAWAILRWRLGR